MALPNWYDSGLVSVANGSTSVTGTNTLWGDDAIMAGDMFCDLAQPLVPPQRIASVENDGALTLAAPWPGTALTDAAYEIRYVGIIERSTAQTRRLLEQMSVVQANGRGLFYRFSDSVTDADPGSGALGLNNAIIGSATAAYADNLDANGAAVAGDLDTWDDSTSPIKGKLWLRSISSPSSFHAFSVTGSVVDGTGYRKLTLTYVGGSGGFTDGEELMVFFVPKGDQGEGFITDADVSNPSELSAHESEDPGFLVFVTDLGTDFGAFEGISGVVKLIDGPDWEVVARYTGDKGDKGDQGDKGWSPQIVVVSDGARRVHQLAGYVGGEGSAPTANVGDYLKGDGTFTSTIGDAADVRGPAGLNGAGTVASVEAGTGIAVDNTDPTAPVVSLASIGRRRNMSVNGSLLVSHQNGDVLGTSNGYFYADQKAFYRSADLAGKISAQRVAYTSLEGGSKAAEFKCISTASIAATSIATDTDFIEGADPEFVAAGWGSAGAKPIMYRKEVQKPAGTYSFYVTNRTKDRHLWIQYVIEPGDADVPVVVEVQIPGDTTGTWSKAEGEIGCTIDDVLVLGSDYVGGAEGVWGGTDYRGGAGQKNFCDSTSNVAHHTDFGARLDADDMGAYGGYRVGEVDAVYRAERYVPVVRQPVGLAINTNSLYNAGAVVLGVRAAKTPTLLSGTFSVNAGAAGTVGLYGPTAYGAGFQNASANWSPNAIVSVDALLNARLS